MRLIFPLLMLVPLASMATPTEPEVAWSKKEVTVCFGDNTHKRFSAAISLSGQFADFSDKEKKAIKSIITQEYTSETTGISFVGWEDCQPDVINADVVLLRPDLPDSRESGAYTEVGGVATIGERGWLTKRVDERTQKEVDVYVKWPQDLPRKNVITISTKQAQSKKVGAEKYIQMLALHEFGHTAGLGHQHLRKEAAKADPNCKFYEDMLKKINS